MQPTGIISIVLILLFFCVFLSVMIIHIKTDLEKIIEELKNLK